MYIGSSANVQHRIWEHLNCLEKNKHHSVVLQREFNKYGLEKFKFYLVKEIKKRDRGKLVYWEQYFIDYYSPEYNMCPEAFSCLGRICTQSHRDKIAKAIRGIKRSEETKRRVAKGWERRRQYPVSEETRKRLSEVWKGRKQTPEHIRHRVEARKKTGKPWHSEETKKKLCWNKGMIGGKMPESKKR